MRYSLPRVALLVLALGLGACAAGPQFAAGEPCVTPIMTVVDDFSGARRGRCTVLDDDHVRLDIRPEDPPPINDSPWFALRVDPQQAARARFTLRYHDGHHRYRPKISYNGLDWLPLNDSDVSASRSGRKASFEIDLDGRPLFIAAQELITPPLYDAWLQITAAKHDIGLSELGRSRRGLPIYQLDTGGDADNVLLIVGRQHPPEVSGAYAFLAFAETVLGGSELAMRFREHYRIIAVPLLNPDGVIGGNWRHSLGGVDLNRDWGPFTQPETQAVRDLLAVLDAEGRRIRLFLDFHSTKRNVFYTQNDDFVTDPPQFMAIWLERAARRIADYDFENDQRPVSDQANSKNYMYKRYGIPTATYEVGDETDRHATQVAARVFAEELMTLLLEQDF